MQRLHGEAYSQLYTGGSYGLLSHQKARHVSGPRGQIVIIHPSVGLRANWHVTPTRNVYPLSNPTRSQLPTDGEDGEDPIQVHPLVGFQEVGSVVVFYKGVLERFPEGPKNTLYVDSSTGSLAKSRRSPAVVSASMFTNEKTKHKVMNAIFGKICGNCKARNPTAFPRPRPPCLFLRLGRPRSFPPRWFRPPPPRPARFSAPISTSRNRLAADCPRRRRPASPPTQGTDSPASSAVFRAQNPHTRPLRQSSPTFSTSSKSSQMYFLPHRPSVSNLPPLLGSSSTSLEPAYPEDYNGASPPLPLTFPCRTTPR